MAQKMTDTAATSTANDHVSVATEPVKAARPDVAGFFWGTGRRKSAVARVRIRPGEGKYLINKKQIDEYFTELRDRQNIVNPLKATRTEGNLDVFVNVNGGGYTKDN